MVGVLVSRVVDRGFESLWGQTKDYTIGVCCFSSEDSIKEKGAKTGWNLLGIRIMCASGLTRLSTD